MRKRYMIKIVGQAIVLLFIILVINFILVRLMPGDPLQNIIGEEDYFKLYYSSPEVLDELRIRYGLDGGILEQFIRYMKDILKLNFGYSYKNSMPVLNELLYNVKWTLLLLIPTIIMSSIFGAILGIIGGWNSGKRLDSILTPFALIFKSIPGNCLAIIILMIFSYKLRLFPLSGMVSGGNLKGIERFVSIFYHSILPIGVLTIYRTSSNFLLMKSIVLQIKDEEYINVAFSKGLTEWQVIIRHVFINALSPYMTAICMQMGGLISGATFIEIVFSWRGMGILYFNAMNVRDFPVLQLCFLISAIFVIFFDMVGNILNLLIDPRIKGGEQIE